MNERVGLGITVGGSVSGEIYLNHIGTIASWAKKFDLTLLGTCRTIIDSARNKIVKAAIEEKLTHVLFIDADHIIPESMLPLLLRNSDAAMVSGLVCKRGYPYETVAFMFDSNHKLCQAQVSARDKVLEVDGCAFGCTLINLSQLQLLDEPYFFNREKGFRSDLNLCMRFKDIGKRILLDTRIHIGHLGDTPQIFPHNAEEFRVKHLDKVRAEENDESSN